MHTISSYPVNRPRNKQTQPQTDRQHRLQYTAPQLARSVMTSFVDGQPSDIISLHCAHYALTHDTVPPAVSQLVFQYLIALVLLYNQLHIYNSNSTSLICDESHRVGCVYILRKLLLICVLKSYFFSRYVIDYEVSRLVFCYLLHV